MKKFYITYPKQQTLSVKLSWSHYCELLSIEDKDAKSFYEKEGANSNWSVRELKKDKLILLYLKDYCYLKEKIRKKLFINFQKKDKC